MNLTCYKYEKNSRAYCGAESVPPYVSHDRLIYELPPNATLVEPMLAPKKMTPMFVPSAGGGGHWVLMADHRGEPGWVNWKGEAVVILGLGNPEHRQFRRIEAVLMEKLQGEGDVAGL